MSCFVYYWNKLTLACSQCCFWLHIKEHPDNAKDLPNTVQFKVEHITQLHEVKEPTHEVKEPTPHCSYQIDEDWIITP
jgi:hypothetical protein